MKEQLAGLLRWCWMRRYRQCAPARLIFDRKPGGNLDDRKIYWEHQDSGPRDETVFPIAQHEDLLNRP